LPSGETAAQATLPAVVRLLIVMFGEEFLGGALLANEDFAAAEEIFRAEIAKHPRNGRALFGLAESLKRQGKTTSAQMVLREFEKAWEKSDTKLRVEDF